MVEILGISAATVAFFPQTKGHGVSEGEFSLDGMVEAVGFLVRTPPGCILTASSNKNLVG